MRLNKVWFFLIILCFSCKDPKLVRKNVTDGNINVKWYYYSYISNTGPDIIEVKKKDSIVQILRADEIIVDVVIQDKKIIIKTFENASPYIHSDSILTEVYGYKIVLDTTLPTHDKYHVPRNVTKEY
ncbi:MAG TPA: hypothetical protein VEA37_15100, partial [Flavobacterium sp.]|nr:hypothetical protein [Flavobacterium sp.]